MARLEVVNNVANFHKLTFDIGDASLAATRALRNMQSSLEGALIDYEGELEDEGGGR